ncbi:MAG: carbohydrate ABC transporter substrate-binding protein [Defluviitaleaceae bacterium]|nr:carbohydrate ABC transporter substrate-binding protein [Defluviitaleaceae bacterium]
MKKWLVLTLAIVAVLAFAACGNDDGGTAGGGGGAAEGGGGAAGGGGGAAAAGRTTINLWSFTDEVPRMVERYKEMNPDFAERFNVVPNIVATDDGAYQLALDMALVGGGADMPDIFTAESAFVIRYTQGDMSQFAATYSDVGIANLSGRIADARIAPYIVDMGTRNGDVVGLAFQHTGSGVIYRRSLAQEVWGTDDPVYVGSRIGPGWDRFFDAARDMYASGFAMVSGAGDVWQAVRNTGGPWIVDGSLNIHPDRMAHFDFARILYQENLMNDAGAWSSAWFADMGGVGERPVFGFLGPAWLINHVMAGNAGDTYGDWGVAVPPVGFSWGGTWVIPSTNATRNADVSEGVRRILEWITLDTSMDGLQQHWANGTLFPGSVLKDAVASGVVMDRSDGTLPFLGGMDMFDTFIPAGEFADGTLFTQHDEFINARFEENAMNYARGDMTREEALANFRTLVSETLGIN